MSLVESVEKLLSGPHPAPIVQAGDPVLRRLAEPYDGSLPADLFAELILLMRQTMLAAPGVGLAAPQIGLGVRIAVIEDQAAVAPEVANIRDRVPLAFRVLVNPSYSPVGDELATFYEGCLSVAGYQAVVSRASTVLLTSTNPKGEQVEETVTGWAARIVAHETDHLDGMLYLDRAFTRSLANTDNYLARWATPAPDAARVQLGF